MTKNLSLNGKWLLTYAEGSPLSRVETFVLPQEPCYREMLETNVPETVHSCLQRYGKLPMDLNYGTNILQARWVEEIFWIYRRKFVVDEETFVKTKGFLLNFSCIECIGKLWINGIEIGISRSALIEVEFDITQAVKMGENEIVLLVESGSLYAADLPSKGYGVGPQGENSKRHWLRKPQYQSGWDWNPRLQSIGLCGDVKLSFVEKALLKNVGIYGDLSDDFESAKIVANFDVHNFDNELTGKALLINSASGEIIAEKLIEIAPNSQTYQVSATLPNPKLWYPIGFGEQNLYEFKLVLDIQKNCQEICKKVGIRKVVLNQNKHETKGNYCILEVNNLAVFCRGANLVPADLFYNNATIEHQKKIAELSIEANFNMLRIWGGGSYISSEFASFCDEVGLLVWHDFMFACAKYPGDNIDFRRQVEQEVRAVTRRLTNHPSIVCWCGNNELEWAAESWKYCEEYNDWIDHALFHHYIPRIAGQEIPQSIYYPSSPMSPNYQAPNDSYSGDQHPWSVSLNSLGAADFFQYRSFEDRFPNEGGILGASSLLTLEEFLPENERYLFSWSFDYHDNVFAIMNSDYSQPGHTYLNFDYFFGMNPRAMSLGDFAYYGGLIQSEGLKEYISNYRRRKFDSASAIFWMLNDSWKVTNGWSIIDYNLRKKLAFYSVKRAFKELAVVVVKAENEVLIYGVNDTLIDAEAMLNYGIFKMSGGKRYFESTSSVTLFANKSTIIGKVPFELWQQAGLHESGIYAQLIKDGEILSQYHLLGDNFKNMTWSKPKFEISQTETHWIIKSDVFVLGVVFDLSGELDLEDNAIDLVPNLDYVIPRCSDVAELKVIRFANEWFAQEK